MNFSTLQNTGKILTFLCSITLFFLSYEPSSALPDSTGTREARMFVGYINHDTLKDTIIGRTDSTHQLIASEIIWGRPTQPAQPGDTTYYTPVNTLTELSYPLWDDFTCTIAIDQINADTLNDLVFYYWGTIPSSAGVVDTMKVVVVFGQRGLDSLLSIDLGNIDTLQTSPFVARELRLGTDLTDSEVRDYSGSLSYIFPQMNVIIGDTSSGPPILPLIGSQPDLQVYPNPAVYSTSIRAIRIPAGEYRIDLLSTQGKVLLEQNVTVDESGELLKSLNFTSLTTGYYIIRLYSKETHIGSYPVTVVH